MLRSTVLVVVGALVLTGCETAMPNDSNGNDEGPDIEIPTVKVPLVHVGLQGKPTKFQDRFIHTVADDPMPW